MLDWFRRGRQRGTPAELEGRTLGKYRMLRPLGRGGMARVYRAYHAQLDRYVAVKVLRPDLVGGDELNAESWRARFQREARAVAALRHPNVVRVFDFDVERGLSYIVMECLEGDSLKTRLNDYRVRGERMAVGEAVRILLDTLSGLAYAHSEGMIHRDLKPGNVLLTKRGDAVLSDFGIAQMVGDTRRPMPGALVGTVNYMAPEQGRDGRSDRRSDVYSVGVIFYEMLVQRLPFEADTPLAVVMKHVDDPLPLPRQIDPSIPEPFERIILKALAKDPDDRYQSAEEMAQAIRKAAEDVRVALPDRISPPLSFTTPGAPSDSVAVFSGAERARIGDDGFATGQTATTLEKRSLLERLTAGEPLLTRSSAILLAMGLISFGNLAAFTVVGVTGLWTALSRGWPLEFFLVAAALSVVMHATGSAYLVIPLGVLLGNGFIFTYCTFTGNWRHWLFLWVFELWVIASAIVGARWLLRRSRRSHRLNRLIPLILAPMALGLSILVAYGSIAFSILDMARGWVR